MASHGVINEGILLFQLIANDFHDSELGCVENLRTCFLSLSCLFSIYLLIILDYDRDRSHVSISFSDETQVNFFNLNFI